MAPTNNGRSGGYPRLTPEELDLPAFDELDIQQQMLLVCYDLLSVTLKQCATDARNRFGWHNCGRLTKAYLQAREDFAFFRDQQRPDQDQSELRAQQQEPQEEGEEREKQHQQHQGRESLRRQISFPIDPAILQPSNMAPSSTSPPPPPPPPTTDVSTSHISPSVLASIQTLASQTSDPTTALAVLTSAAATNLTTTTATASSPRETQDQLLRDHPTLAQMQEIQERQRERVKDVVEKHVRTKAECEQQLEKLKLEWETYTRLEKKLKEKKGKATGGEMGEG
ncbi:MAG: hypothetical protein M1837_004063 [Sclerophora amabilis]|nr:MAG: hypothetical protein M1837_004063 [Sclerophora amabilis]